MEANSKRAPSADTRPLKGLREAMGFSIPDVAAALNVNTRYISLLEEPELGVEALAESVPLEHAIHYYNIYSLYLAGHAGKLAPQANGSVGMSSPSSTAPAKGGA